MKGVITLCGSTRFYKTFDKICYELTVADYAIFTIGTMLNSDKRLVQSQETLERFKQLHYSKILMSDAIFVIDVDGYVGEDTQSEIDFANENGRLVYKLSLGHLDVLKKLDNIDVEGIQYSRTMPAGSTMVNSKPEEK